VARPPRAAALLAAGLLGLPLAGCHGSTPAPPLPGASAPMGSAATSPGPTAGGSPVPGADLVTVAGTGPGDRAGAHVFADYVRFWQRDMLALRSNDLRTSGVLDYLFAPQLQRTAIYLADQRRAGRHTEGVVTIRPNVVSVTGRSAVVSDCLDQSRSYDVDRAGRRIPPARRNLPLTVALQLGAGDRWRVSDLAPRSGTC